MRPYLGENENDGIDVLLSFEFVLYIFLVFRATLLIILLTMAQWFMAIRNIECSTTLLKTFCIYPIPFYLYQCHFNFYRCNSSSIKAIRLRLHKHFSLEECSGFINDKIIWIVPVSANMCRGGFYFSVFCPTRDICFSCFPPEQDVYLIFINNHFSSCSSNEPGYFVVVVVVWKWTFLRCSPQWLFSKSVMWFMDEVEEE